MAQATKVIYSNYYSDGTRYAELYKSYSVYEVRYYTGDSHVSVKWFPSKQSAMDFIKYFMEG